jgi:phage-related protein
VNGKFAGSAAGYADTTQGRIEQVTITLTELGESIGSALLPIVNDLLKVFIDKGLPVIQSVVGAITGFITTNRELIGGIIETAANIAGRVVPVLANVAGFIFTQVIPAVAGFIGKLVSPGGMIDSVGKVVGPILANLIPAMGKLLSALGEVAGKVLDFVGVIWGDGKGPLAIAVQLIGGSLSFIVDVLGNIVGAVGKAMDAIAKIGKAIMDSPLGIILRLMGSVIGGVANLVGGTTPTLAGATTGGSGGGNMGGRFAPSNITVRNNLVFGNDAISRIDTKLGTAVTAGSSRTNR